MFPNLPLDIEWSIYRIVYQDVMKELEFRSQLNIHLYRNFKEEDYLHMYAIRKCPVCKVIDRHSNKERYIWEIQKCHIFVPENCLDCSKKWSKCLNCQKWTNNNIYKFPYCLKCIHQNKYKECLECKTYYPQDEITASGYCGECYYYMMKN